MMNEINKNIVDLINAKELVFAKFKVSYDNNNNSIHLVKGKKYMTIKYNTGTDLYDIKAGEIKNFALIETTHLVGIFFDMVRNFITDHFKFEYVMENFARY